MIQGKEAVESGAFRGHLMREILGCMFFFLKFFFACFPPLLRGPLGGLGDLRKNSQGGFIGCRLLGFGVFKVYLRCASLNGIVPISGIPGYCHL